MKRMNPYILAVMAALGVCGWLVVRHAVQAAVKAAGSGLPKPKAIDRWQSEIRVDLRTDYVTEPKERKRIEKALRAEELRQQPWEGHN